MPPKGHLSVDAWASDRSPTRPDLKLDERVIVERRAGLGVTEAHTEKAQKAGRRLELGARTVFQ